MIAVSLKRYMAAERDTGFTLLQLLESPLTVENTLLH